jgi:hypothetical protein
MNIHKLRHAIRLVPSVNDITHGNEFLFTQKVKSMLPGTNFELLGEQLIVGKDNTIGKCDLWLANIPNRFLLSLELKVGDASDSSKRKFLKTQVFKYTDYMRFYFPEEIVYGMGAYKCIIKHGTGNNASVTGSEIRFTDYIDPTNNNHSQEIEYLKSKMRKDCLN